MPAIVIGQSGKGVKVATLDDVTSGEANVPVATTSTAGTVIVGDNVEISDTGVLSVPAATDDVYGVVKQASPIPDVQTITVTDIDSAASAIAAMGTTLSELMQALRDAEILRVSDPT